MAVQSPGHFGALYRRYKADNALIATWLGRTAVRCGYSRAGLAIKAQERQPDAISKAGGQDAEKNGENEAEKATGRTAKQLRSARKKAKQRLTRRNGEGLGSDGEAGEEAGPAGRDEPHVSKTTAPARPSGSASTRSTSSKHSRSTPTHQPQQYVITIYDHLSMSRHIAFANIQASPEFLETLKRCIRYRKRMATYYPDESIKG